MPRDQLSTRRQRRRYSIACMTSGTPAGRQVSEGPLILWSSGVVLLFAITACGSADDNPVEMEGPRGPREAAIVLAELDDDERTLVISFDACDADNNDATVSESTDTVTVTVVTDDPPGGPSCADGLRITLDEALGSRNLIDGSTGEVLDVSHR